MEIPCCFVHTTRQYMEEWWKRAMVCRPMQYMALLRWSTRRCPWWSRMRCWSHGMQASRPFGMRRIPNIREPEKNWIRSWSYSFRLPVNFWMPMAWSAMNARVLRRMISSEVWQRNIRMWKYISYPVTVTCYSWLIRQRMSIWWKRVSRKWKSWMRQSWRKAWESYPHRLLIWRHWWEIPRITYRAWRASVKRRHSSF